MNTFHPSANYVCRHCKGSAGNEPELCVYCGPICDECFDKPCPKRPAQKSESEKPPFGGAVVGLSNTV